jgi:acetyl-CoA carboxylase beta subunit
MPLNLVVPEGGQRMQDAVEQLARMVEVRVS